MRELGIAVIVAAVIATAVPLAYRAAGMEGDKVLPPLPRVSTSAAGSGSVATPAGGLTGVALGQAVVSRSGCLACHSTGAQAPNAIGPSWKGLAGKTETLQDGSTVTVDDAYLRESIVNPNAKIVRGFQPVMPPFNSLRPEEVDAVVEYIKTIQ